LAPRALPAESRPSELICRCCCCCCCQQRGQWSSYPIAAPPAGRPPPGSPLPQRQIGFLLARPTSGGKLFPPLGATEGPEHRSIDGCLAKVACASPARAETGRPSIRPPVRLSAPRPPIIARPAEPAPEVGPPLCSNGRQTWAPAAGLHTEPNRPIPFRPIPFHPIPFRAPRQSSE